MRVDTVVFVDVSVITQICEVCVEIEPRLVLAALILALDLDIHKSILSL